MKYQALFYMSLNFLLLTYMPVKSILQAMLDMK